MSRVYRIELGSFDSKGRSWNVNLLTAANVRLVELTQAGAPLLAHLWEHSAGSPTILWRETEDEPPDGLVAVVELKVGNAEKLAVAALSVGLAVSLFSLAYLQRELQAEQLADARSRLAIASFALEAKNSAAQLKAEKLNSLARELFTGAGVNYAKR